MKVLLTFTGFHDPYTVGLVGEEEQPGPILSLVGARSFDRIILFSTPNTEKHTSATGDALLSLYPHLDIEVRDLPLDDPTDYITILRNLRSHIQDICESTLKATYFIAVASGTPQMHACWVLLAGEIRLPSLRERRSDIPKVALYILDRVNATLRTPKRLSSEALSRLQHHSWPGNVRDLENVIERSVRLAKKEVLEADDLLIFEPVTSADPFSVLPEPHDGFSLEAYLTTARKQLIMRALESAKGNQSEAARFLGITPQAVHKFLQKAER